jgi:soluble cytochrome b562
MPAMKKFACLVLMSGVLAVVPSTTRYAFAAEDTELAKQMEVMDDDLKKLRKSVKEATQNKETLETITKLQAATVASKGLTPAKAAQVPEADRAKFVTGYRKDMITLLKHLGDIEIAVLDGDNAKAEELFKGMKKMEDDGHEKYSDE